MVGKEIFLTSPFPTGGSDSSGQRRRRAVLGGGCPSADSDECSAKQDDFFGASEAKGVHEVLLFYVSLALSRMASGDDLIADTESRLGLDAAIIFC